jgi:beta-carotene 15,15'-dioxygenase
LPQDAVFESGIFSAMSAIGKHPSARAHWFLQTHTRLTLIWSCASLLLTGGWALASYPGVPLVMQLWIVALGVGLFGVLHGGLDHIVGERVFKRVFTRRWLIYFAMGYVGLAIAVMIGWWLVAPIMLLLFLAVSILHFGLRDGARGGVHAQQKRTAWIQFATVILLGAVPIMIPWIAFPQEVSVLFGWLAGTHPEAWQPSIHISDRFGSMPQVAMVLVAVALVLMLYFKSRRLLDTFAWIEFLATILLFWTLPPLLAFAWYFCFLHSLRHLLALAERLAPSREWSAVGWVILRGLPLTIMTLVAAAAGYVWLRGFDLSETESATKVIFWGLAALTFPHMLLTWWWERCHESLDRP